MALVQKQLTGKKQTVLTAVMLGVILTTALVVYFGYFRASRPKPAPSPPAGGDVSSETGALSVQPRGKSSLDLLDSLSQDPVWQRLKRFGRYPLPLAPRGNLEPFKLPAAPPAQ